MCSNCRESSFCSFKFLSILLLGCLFLAHFCTTLSLEKQVDHLTNRLAVLQNDLTEERLLVRQLMAVNRVASIGDGLYKFSDPLIDEIISEPEQMFPRRKMVRNAAMPTQEAAEQLCRPGKMVQLEEEEIAKIVLETAVQFGLQEFWISEMIKNSSGKWQYRNNGLPVNPLFSGDREDHRPVSWYRLEENAPLSEAGNVARWKKLPKDMSLQLGNRHPALCQYQRKEGERKKLERKKNVKLKDEEKQSWHAQWPAIGK